MAETLFSSSWYRVATLKPRLRSHAEIHRHRYRGQLWYVLQDHASQRYHRFYPAAYYFLGLMDGRRTVQEVWDMASTHLGDDAPTQDEVIRLLTQLHAVDVLQCDVPPDTAELLLRFDRQRRYKWQSQLMSPLFWSFPLFDPERVLERFLPYVRPFFGPLGALLWIFVVGTALIQAAIHWPDLSENVVDRVLAPQNVLLLWLVFPIIKTLHEFGHAFATKAYGGEVHDMGVMLLVLMPLPYVDASAASAFRSTWQRVIVGAAGMIVELFLASLALFFWLNLEPGTLRLVAYNVMFIAGVSTILFNGNPLLRYDGYYILADLLEMPNLRMRSQAYMSYLCERYLFGQRETESEAATASERAWFVFFSVASWLYRLFVLVAITLFVAGKFFFVGVIFALGGVVAWGIVPTGKLLSYLGTNPRLRHVRVRAIVVSSLIAAALIGIIGWLPVPLGTQTEGVIWVPYHAIVRAHTNGFIARVVATPGSQVQQGDVLILCEEPTLQTRVQVLEARLQEMQTRYTMEWMKDQAQADILKEEIALAQGEVAQARERVAELTIRSHADGTFVVPQAQDLPGQFVQRGTQLAYVLDLTTVTARVVLSQTQIELVRHHTQKVEVRFAEHLDAPVQAVVKREVPGATEELPSPVLSSQGGGAIAIDPTNTHGMKALSKLFQLDLEMPSRTGIVTIGGRVYVRFDHGREPLGYRWYRQIRRLFLSKFHV